jgi:outer membrane protein assembly factor BamB/Tfp pilus assembly protein PilF
MSQEDLSTRRYISRYHESLAHLERGLALFEAGDVSNAIDELEKALLYDRENTLAHGNLGLIYRQLGRLDEAERAYLTAMELEPRDPWLHRGLGAVYEAKERPDRAQEEYRQAVELDPTDAQGRYELGNALLAEKKLEAAVDEFCDALEIDPGLDEARNQLAAIYRGRGMNEAALEQYGIVARRNKDNEIGQIAAQRMALIGHPQWPMARRDPARTAHEPSSLIPPLGIRWQFDVLGDVAAPLIMFNGVVYVACTASHTKGGMLYALDAVTGEEIWRFTVLGGATAVSISTTPVAHDGLVLVGTTDGVLYALDAAVGRIAWQWDTQGAIRSALAVVANIVYVGSEDHHLYALDLLTGRERWRLETEEAANAASAVRWTLCVAEDRLFVSSGARRFRAVDAVTGTDLWSANIGTAVSTPVVLGPTVFVATTEHQLYALVTASGKRRWVSQFKPIHDGFSDMAAWENRLYLSYGNVLAALDIISGQIEWEVPVADVEALSAPALAGQMLYVTAMRPGQIYAFDIARGRKRWEYELPYPLATPPSVTHHAILVGSTGSLRETSPGRRAWTGTVFALGPES